MRFAIEFFYPISFGFQFYFAQYINRSNNNGVTKYQMPLGMGELKKLDLYKMVNPTIKIGLFLTYLCSLSLITFQPTYIPYVNLFTKYDLKR